MFSHPLFALGPVDDEAMTLYLDDLVCDASIGVHAHEQVARQRIAVRVAVRLHTPPGPAHTRLEHVLDYNHLRDAVLRRATTEHVFLQETLCRHIADDCLALPGVQAVYVAVGKLDAFADSRAVGCELVRRRPAP